MRSAQSDEEFVAFVTASMRDLRRTAYLLCGDWQRAEDAVQNALIKVYVRWPKLEIHNSTWSYARRAVVTSVMDEARSARRRREDFPAELPEVEVGDGTGTVDDQLLLRSALAALPARQRAVVVLRYVYELDVQETAFVVKCAVGTVGSSASRALAFLRTYLEKRGVRRGARRDES